MRYNYYQGVTRKQMGVIGIALVAMLFALTGALGMISPSMAASHLLDPFTQDELENNWVADRQYPSGGVESVSFEERDNVAEIGVVADEQQDDAFRQFEGIKKVDDFGAEVQVDLYVPAEWELTETSPANVGFWASDDPITAYPLIVFRNSATVDAGFYVYDTQTGAYIPSNVAVEYDDWNTLSIALDTEEDNVNYDINGQSAGSSYAGSDSIGQVFLNHYNDGERDYSAHWHVGVEEEPQPQTKDECKRGGFADFGFRNQGQCIRFVNTGQDSRE